MSTSLRHFRVRIADPSEVVGLPEIESPWDELARKSPHPYAFFASPAWWYYSRPAIECERSAIAIVESPDGSIVAVVPARAGNQVLNYAVSSFAIAKARLRMVNIVGCEPVIPNDDRIFIDLILSLLEDFEDCDGIHLEWVSFQGGCWTTMLHSRGLRRDVLVYVPAKVQGCHFINLPDSYDRYLAKFSAKRRYNLRRQIRLLREHGAGRLDCLRIEHDRDVPYLLEAGSRVAVQSSVYRNRGWNVLENTTEMCQKLTECARRGVLRSYLLRCGDDVCAFIKGYQYNETYYVSFIGFDERFWEFSPGTTLHCMAVEDLCRDRRPKRINLGTGEWPYLDMIGTDKVSGTAVLLLRKTLRNRLVVASHSALRSSVDAARRLRSRLRSTKTVASKPAADSKPDRDRVHSPAE
jgi:hypothetical protein